MTEEKIPYNVTPIKRAKKHQSEKGAPEADLDLQNFKSYDTVFNSREKVVYYNEKSGDVVIDGKLYNVDVDAQEGFYLTKVGDNHAYRIEYHAGKIFLEGREIDFNFNPSIPKLERKTSVREGESIITAPLPGNVIEIAVKAGDSVKDGQKILTLEAMKMQNDILADQNGKVKEIYVKKGDLVSTDQKLMRIVSDKEKSD